MRAPLVAWLSSIILTLTGTSTAGPIDVIRAVDKEGQGNVAAAAAFAELVRGDASQLGDADCVVNPECGCRLLLEGFNLWTEDEALTVTDTVEHAAHLIAQGCVLASQIEKWY